MTYKRIALYLILALFSINSYGQQLVEGITKESYDNAKNTYNYTYWDASWKTGDIATRKFSNQTSSYNLNIDYTNLNILSLKINSNPNSATGAFAEPTSFTFNTLHSGEIDYKVLQDGYTLLEKRSADPTTEGIKVSQMADYGTWCNRRLIDNLNFDGYATVNPTYSGIEFTNWHNRFRISFLFTPTQDISNSQLQLSVEMPAEYSKVLHSGGVFGFATSDTLEGFSLKGGITTDSIFMCGNTLTVRSASQTFNSDNSYQISLIFYAVKDNFCKTYASIPDDAEDLIITTAQTLPNTTENAEVSYVNDEGVYYIDIPEYNMGYGNESTIDLMQNINLQINNSQAQEKRVRLCFREKRPKNVVGFSSMLRNPDGDPTGIPLQISKNWHNGNDIYYMGPWVKEYTELIVPGNSTLKFDYTRVGARWGKVFAASSHQLSVAGAGVPRGGWLEAALGGFGESITHSPDYEYGNSNICDYRPFLVTNQYYGGSTQEYSWTGNLGGMDLFRYENGSQRIYQSQVKTRFKKYGPNLSETSISTYSADNKLKMDYTFHLHRSDDFVRVYYKVKVKALEDTPFTRFDIFQMGSDNYLCFTAHKVAYGNSEGVLSEFQPSTGTVGYTMDATPMPGKDPWLWAGDGRRVKADGAEYTNLMVDANNSFIIRSYDASFGGVENDTPYFRERTAFHSATNKYPPSYCIVPPAGVSSFTKGDSVEFVIELCLMPKVDEVYYGPNINFKNALTTYGDSWELLYREVVGNTIVASSATNAVDQGYPLTVETVNNAATVNIKSGIGYIPIVFTGLTNIKDPKLWRIDESGSTLIDQSNYGKDFWQSEYDTETGLYEIIYNLNHDTEGDTVPDYTYTLEVSSIDSIISVESPPLVLPDDCIPSEPIPINCNSTGEIKLPQTISFPAFPAMKPDAEDFDPGATASSGLPVTYESSDTAVATIVDGKIHIVNSGSTIITARQAGNDVYYPVLVSQTLNIPFTGSNIATSGTATQSTTDFGGEASRAIDGNTDGAYGSGSVTHTETEADAWWQVDLGTDKSISHIRVFGRTDECCISRLSNFSILVINDAGEVTFSETFSAPPDPYVLSNVGGAIGRIVKVVLNVSSVLSLAEVQVFELPPPPVNVSDLVVTPENASLFMGDNLSLTAEVIPANADNTNVSWNSSNSEVATVSTGGLVTAISAGAAYIKAISEDGAYSDSCAITVSVIPCSGVDISQDSIFLLVDSTQQLDASVIPSSAFDQRINWISSNTTISTVDEFGLVTAEGVGTALITATTVDGDYKDTCTVVISSNVGINYDKFPLSEIRVYPNPANNKLSILSLKEKIETIRLFNSVGTELSNNIQISGGGEKCLVDVSAIPNGVYILIVNSSYHRLIVFK